MFIRRYLVNKLGLRVTVVPWDYDFTQDHFDGLFLSNFGQGFKNFNLVLTSETCKNVGETKVQRGSTIYLMHVSAFSEGPNSDMAACHFIFG